MPVYVDGLVEHPLAAYHGDGQAKRVGARNMHRWCHLYADTADELHAFAARLGMRRAWAHVSHRGTPHYDLTPGRRSRAVALGALALDRRAAASLRARLRDGRAA
jgi:hypothetical protein